ncbi:winged helix-turn-helix transcriptional regulator [Streptomyces sp. NPDC048462]|uniref:winged helix-turn-helix transcriptional regulator n=1 Tax=Streptomyces sp. NPDC048462 TaxID=3365555 RepID=UPI00371F93A7
MFRGAGGQVDEVLATEAEAVQDLGHGGVVQQAEHHGAGGRGDRGGELRRALPGVTEKVLASHLRELEAAGIVFREEAFEGAVRRVTYGLTPLGTSLNAALAPLGAWGREHLLGGDPQHAEGVGERS